MRAHPKKGCLQDCAVILILHLARPAYSHCLISIASILKNYASFTQNTITNNAKFSIIGFLAKPIEQDSPEITI